MSVDKLGFLLKNNIWLVRKSTFDIEREYSSDHMYGDS